MKEGDTIRVIKEMNARNHQFFSAPRNNSSNWAPKIIIGETYIAECIYKGMVKLKDYGDSNRCWYYVDCFDVVSEDILDPHDSISEISKNLIAWSFLITLAFLLIFLIKLAYSIL